MKIEEKGNTLVITIDKNPKPTLSLTGKTFQVASSHGNTPTSLQIDGQVVICGVNVYTKNPDYKAPPK